MLNKFLSACLLAASAPLQAATEPNYWPDIARTDLDFVYQTLKDNHPGALDKQNPYFKQWMEKGYAAASASAKGAASVSDVKRVLARYAAGFGDMHLQVGFNQSANSLNWPGLVMGRSGARYSVTGRADDWPAALPAIGATLLSCDGRAPDTLMNDDVLPALYNTPGLAAVKNMFMFQFFADSELAPHRYRSCVFSDAAGNKEFTLKWQGISRVAYVKHWDKANPTVPKTSSMTEVAPKTWWIHLPQFNPGPDEEKELKALIARTATLRDAELLIFDTRGNGGGNSQWGDDVLEGLYGAPYLDHLKAKQASQGYAEYRVSQGNLDYNESALAVLTRQFGAGSSSANNQAGLVARMRAALAAGTPFLRQTPAAPAKLLPAKSPQPLTRARAVLVTDSDCVSSCLDFADAVRLLPGMKHLGQTTNADTLFMEVRFVDLPSKLGSLVVSQKVYRNRPRGHNQALVPHLEFDGHISDTETLRPWVLQNRHSASNPPQSTGSAE